ncbi:helix-turn-helix protein [compost metagenome]
MAHRPMCLLRVRRQARGISQEELSELLKKLGVEISQQAISKIENNNAPMSPLVWRACSMVLDIPMEKFYQWPPLLMES